MNKGEGGWVGFSCFSSSSTRIQQSFEEHKVLSAMILTEMVRWPHGLFFFFNRDRVYDSGG